VLKAVKIFAMLFCAAWGGERLVDCDAKGESVAGGDPKAGDGIFERKEK
jgi:hypothetical protein